MTAYVICCNDAVEFVVLDDKDKAKKTLEALAKDEFDNNRYGVICKDYKDYRSQYYWHIHTVEYDGVDNNPDSA